MESLFQNTRTQRVMNAVDAGTSDQNGLAVDMRNYEGVMFIAHFGALTSGQVTSLRAQQSLASASGYVDITDAAAGPLANADSNDLLVLDVKNPTSRYVRCVIDRGTANAVIAGVVAIQYGPRKKPATQHSTVAGGAAVTVA